MPNSEFQAENDIFIDRPFPSLLLIILISLVLVLGLLAAPIGFNLIGKIRLFGAIFVIIISGVAILYTSLTLIALVSTKYSLDQTGLDIRFGIWHRVFAWNEINGVYQYKGFFATKVGLPGETPCVRLTNAVILKLTTGKLIYLTPKDTDKMLSKITWFISKFTDKEST
jgi:hypothetical protein